MSDLMIDIETMGTGHNAAMIQLAGVFFDRATGQLGEEFCENISLESCLAEGFEKDASTEQWWSEQNPDVLAQITKNPLPARDAIGLYSDFVGRGKGLSVWSHATFDFVIVQNYLKAFGARTMPYRGARDIRTLVDLSGIDLDQYDWKSGKTHNALDDCKFQITYCVDAMRAIHSGCRGCCQQLRST
ncbi:MAG: 3'-5' exonuclease [Pseudomonadota bacterium]